MGIRRHGRRVVLVQAAACLALSAPIAAAQTHGGALRRDSTSRLSHFGQAVLYGTVTGVAFASVDQWQNDPPQWGKSWSGFGKRAASNLGEFYIQEGVTEGLAAVMHRPLKYPRCACRSVGNRVWWAVAASVTDQLPNGRRTIAVPRIVGAYTGSFAQAAWRPSGDHSRVSTALINGTTSLGIGALINLYYEFLRPGGRTSTMAGDRDK